MPGAISPDICPDGRAPRPPPGRLPSGPEPSRDDPTDVEIVRALLSDRSQGAELLLLRYSRRVNRLVGRLLGSDADHDDLVQRIFCTIIARIATLRDPAKLDHWVHAVVVNTVYAECRKRRVRSTFLASQGSQRQYGDLRRDLETRDLLMYASALLGRMPFRERMVFVLYHAEGHTLEEISDLCAFSMSTVKRRLASANARLNKMVQRQARRST